MKEGTHAERNGGRWWCGNSRGRDDVVRRLLGFQREKAIFLCGSRGLKFSIA
jgi:hypothetical protein